MRVYASVDKNALTKNMNEIRKKVGDNIKIMPVIKADAYGHNAAQTAKALDRYADYFAVAVIEEAVSLRQNGIAKPIMLLGYTSLEDYFEAVRNDITVTVFTYNAAEKLSVVARAEGKKAKLHVAVDTGMSRIGFPCTESGADEVEKISRLSDVILEGIFTHYASADEADRGFTELQLSRFGEFIKLLESRGVDIPIKHTANSAAIMEYPETVFNMVRPGIITYGLYPSGEVDKNKLSLSPAMELKTHVAYVKYIEENDTVSYGRTFCADKKMKIATIPVGYADGYPRLLSNKGRVIINGEYAPILGRICMDQFMVDVSHIEDICEGDSVTLIGRDGGCCISAEEIAEYAQTINYEIICGIGKRVPRVFF